MYIDYDFFSRYGSQYHSDVTKSSYAEIKGKTVNRLGFCSQNSTLSRITGALPQLYSFVNVGKTSYKLRGFPR